MSYLRNSRSLVRVPKAFLKPFYVCYFVSAGHGGIINTLQKYYCRVRGGQCAVLSCLPKEEQIGKCSTKK
uniref:Beta-defensin-like domain-containing protein n=1 Tax=Nomascus leucogenys TaxID=61853 RepID=A0A2I3HNB0_NOMLE